MAETEFRTRKDMRVNALRFWHSCLAPPCLTHGSDSAPTEAAALQRLQGAWQVSVWKNPELPNGLI